MTAEFNRTLFLEATLVCYSQPSSHFDLPPGVPHCNKTLQNIHAALEWMQGAGPYSGLCPLGLSAAGAGVDVPADCHWARRQPDGSLLAGRPG